MSGILVRFYFVVTGLLQHRLALRDKVCRCVFDSCLFLLGFLFMVADSQILVYALASALPTRLSSQVSHYRLPRELDQVGYGHFYNKQNQYVAAQMGVFLDNSLRFRSLRLMSP